MIFRFVKKALLTALVTSSYQINTITEDEKIVDLTDKSHSVYNQIKRGDIEGVKIGAGTHKRLAGVPFRITSKTTGEKMIVAGKDIKIVDEVTLDGLETGKKYKLSGWQMVKEENAELLIDGKRVDSNYTFSADSEKMTVEITYSFDGSALGGQNLVTFEELYDISNPKEPVKVAEHKDINDD